MSGDATHDGTTPRAAVRALRVTPDAGPSHPADPGPDWRTTLTAPGGLHYRLGRRNGIVWAALTTPDGRGVALLEEGQTNPFEPPPVEADPGVEGWTDPPANVTSIFGGEETPAARMPVRVTDAVATGGGGTGRIVAVAGVTYPDHPAGAHHEVVAPSPGGAEYVVSAAPPEPTVHLRAAPRDGDPAGRVAGAFAQLHPEVAPLDAAPTPDHLEVRPGEGAVAYVGDR